MAHISFRKSDVLHKRALLYYPQLQKEQSQYFLQYQPGYPGNTVIVDNTVKPFFVSSNCLCGFLNLSM